MLASYPARFMLAVILFGLTLAFAAAGALTAVVDLRNGIGVWENDLGYVGVAITAGLALLGVGHVIVREKTVGEQVSLEDLFNQD